MAASSMPGAQVLARAGRKGAPMAERFHRCIVWLRRDLRLRDNVALFHAATSAQEVACAFVIDPAILRSERNGAPITTFFLRSLNALRDALHERSSGLAVLEGDPAHALETFAQRVGAEALFFNEDYEPYARERDEKVTQRLSARGIAVRRFTDHVYAGANEIQSSSGRPFVVYTPYKRAWLERMRSARELPVPSEHAIDGKLAAHDVFPSHAPIPAPQTYGLTGVAEDWAAGEAAAQRALSAFLDGPVSVYTEQRNIPALAGTSRLSPHLRAGTIGIRTCIDRALAARPANGAAANAIDAWIAELIWRDFYQQILANFPYVAERPFREQYAHVPWRDAPDDLEAWRTARTGYPIIDAAMTQLASTGWMHNRLRMVTASFLSKHLLIDYRLGERHFERHLVDADLASNNGGWQWAASTGTDAVPYFRVFNPIVQSRTFDPQGTFIRAMLPQLRGVPDSYIHEPWQMPPLVAQSARCVIGRDYPAPIVEHATARNRALAAFKGLARQAVKS